MTEREFIDKINGQYAIAPRLMEGNGGYNINRGMAHTVSGYVEDLFALYMAKKIDDNSLKFFVDKVISIRLEEGKKAKSFKPDLMILDSENNLLKYFDLKTNLGWNRHLENYLNEKNNFIKSIRGNNAWIHIKDKNPIIVKIPNDLKYEMLVVYGQNINKNNMDNNHRIATSLDCVEVKVLYDKIEGEWVINEEAFASLHSNQLSYN